jgi:hypothetical protein
MRSRAITRTLAAGAVLAAALGAGADRAAAATTARVSSGILEITGDAAPNRIALGADPENVFVDVGEDGTADFTFNSTTVTSIRLQGGGGSDRLEAETSLFLASKPLTLNGGPGDDTLAGSPLADVIKGGAGDDLADGNIANDIVELGDGNDHAQWDPGDGSDTVAGDDGTDTLDFNGSNAPENIALSADGSRVKLFRDVAGITMDLSGIQRLHLRTLGSADNVTVGDLTGTKLTEADVDLGGFGGGGDGAADTVTSIGTNGSDHVRLGAPDGEPVVAGLPTRLQVSGAETASDDVNVDTLGGDDAIDGSVRLAGLRAVNVDGVDDLDTLTYSGTAAADQIGIARGANVASAFTPGGPATNAEPTVESLVVQGLEGDDALVGQNGLSAITNLTLLGGPGGDEIRGGDGPDRLLGGSGDDLVDGNIGADHADLGDGDDHFQWDPGDGSDVVQGGDGADTFDFNGSNAPENIVVGANRSAVRLTRDVAQITLDFSGFQRLAVRTLGSADNVIIGNLAGTKLRQADVDLSMFGGGGDATADTVAVQGTPKADTVAVTRSGSQVLATGLPTQTTISGSEPASDALSVNTLDGDDRVTVASDVGDLMRTFVDLGSGQLP